MRRILGWASLCVAALPARVGAQSPAQRPGMAVGIAFGGGMLGVRCDACETKQGHGLSREASLTWVWTPRFQTGVAVTGELASVGGHQDREAAILLVGRGYPIGGRPFFLHAGVGSGHYVSRYQPAGGPVQRFKASGGVWQLGAGYDWTLRSEIALTTQIAWRQHLESDLAFNGAPIGRAKVDALEFGVAVRWRFLNR